MQTSNIQLKVSGIKCPKCVKKIKETLDSTSGITNINVDLECKTVKLSYDTIKFTDLQIKNIIETIPGKDFIVTEIIV